MNLSTYYDRHGLDGERALASKAKINPRYIYQMRTGRRMGTLRMMVRLVEASGFDLTLTDMICEQLGTKLATRYWANLNA